MANYWMSTRLRLLGAVVSGLTALTVVLQANSVDDTAGTANHYSQGVRAWSMGRGWRAR
jgi:hypothetical protein